MTAAQSPSKDESLSRMDAAADFKTEQTAEGDVVRLVGDWTADDLGDAAVRLEQEISGKDAHIDLTGVGRCDTAGAYGVISAAKARSNDRDIEARPETTRLLKLVGEALSKDPAPPPPRHGMIELVERLGRGVISVGHEFVDTLAFNGHLIVAVGRALANPKRIRWAPIVALTERAGLDAIPVVAVTSLFIGAVVGLLGANILTEFGAQVFAVELIGIAVMREFNVLITAVLLAGRSASAFAAEIGAMKMNQEVDAMQVMGVDPFEALVLPRFLALLIMLPLLGLVATLAGLLGGMIVTWAVLDLSPTFFLQRLVDFVGGSHFLIGMSKAPVMATVIAAIGCRQGMEVGGDVESLGRRVTAAVVHAIFSIILIDAVFALIYMELGL